MALDWERHPGLPALRQALVGRPTQQAVGVAFSGGADSTALLLAAWHVWPDRVVALHVNHGLQAAAHDFEQHALGFCQHWQIPLQVARLTPTHCAGASVEEQARNARYRALADLARSAHITEVLLGQHAQDQAETVLLALSRGAGLPGLSGMPERMEREGVVWVRPWLGVSGPALRDWLHTQGVAYVQDPSNADLRFTRNRIRHQVLPALAATWADYPTMLARSAKHAAQAQTLLDELARADLQQTGVPPRIAALQQLSLARQANAVRFWLRAAGARQASDAQLQQLLQQVAACTTRGHRIHLKVGLGWVQRRGDALAFDLLSL